MWDAVGNACISVQLSHPYQGRTSLSGGMIKESFGFASASFGGGGGGGTECGATFCVEASFAARIHASAASAHTDAASNQLATEFVHGAMPGIWTSSLQSTRVGAT